MRDDEQEMEPEALKRTYLLSGLDRILYSRPPEWPEGTFEQTSEFEGRLVLVRDFISNVSDLETAIHQMDLQAERFRWAISRRTLRPLGLRLEKWEGPSFDLAGLASARSTAVFTDEAEGHVAPRPPPAKMEQLPEAAARWILTMAEASTFDGYPDEVIKRLQLLIEELLPKHGACLDAEQRALARQVKLVRDFVSHPELHRDPGRSFIATNLPSAIVCDQPGSKVRFDRTDVEHRNFVGRHEVLARDMANPLLDAAIHGLPQ